MKDDSEASFASKDVLIIPSRKAPPTWKISDESRYLAELNMYDEEVEKSPAISRAWVVQGRFLSHRSLHTTRAQLWFGYRQHLIACEIFPEGYTKASMDPNFAQASEESKEKILADEYKGQQEARWYKLAENYARCGPTVATDKIIAFAGVEGSFTKVFPDN
ncbi:hypothetical protein N0V87_006265 [Didymella glomerata]|uniref:Uncharacterized protein n=1 Tax=Didymella glomerata TaxID=749621 RepID=A0A9W8WXT9_9PLEO|nr:hypothetical protein N0V87_006265 [Didymella glomerata]